MFDMYDDDSRMSSIPLACRAQPVYLTSLVLRKLTLRLTQQAFCQFSSNQLVPKSNRVSVARAAHTATSRG